ncbi:MAG: tetratricopeptide repeat-containing sensor histidine kinase [Vicingaceae bacterium]
MKNILHIIMFLLIMQSLRANEDSLIVYSLLEQAKITESSDSLETFGNKAMDYSEKNNYLDGVLAVAKFFGNNYAKTGELQKSVELYQKIISKNKFDKKQLSTAYNQIGIYHVYMGHYDSTEVYFLKSLAMRKQLNDSVGIGASLNNLGNVVMSKGDYDKATKYYVDALKIREQINDSAGMASSTNNLGMIFYKQKKFEEAIDYYRQALLINQHKKVLDKEVLIFLNLGNIYDEMSQLDSSLYYYNIATQKAETLGNLRLIAMSYGNMGVTQQKLKNFSSAKTYMYKALKIRASSQDLEGQAILYNNLAGVYVLEEKYDSAIYNFNVSLKFSKEIDYKETTRDNYLGLADAYEKANQYKEAYWAHQQYATIKDSMLNETTNEQIAALKTQYETAKKEKEIARQKVEIAEQDYLAQQRNYMLFALLFVLFFILIISAFIYKQQKQKQLQLIAENRLKDEIAQVKIQNELHEERLRISRDLHDNIGSQLTFIISSVDNMKHLFKSADEKLNNKLSDVSTFTRTTITQLRDTIWALNKDEISFDDLKARLYNYIENANLAQEQTKFEFNSTLSSSFQLNSIQGVSIYRIVQEAINNAMKYSAASTVSLSISEDETSVILLIKDDGIGFNMADIQLGNGLENMKSRAQSIGALFNIVSAPDNGTELVLTLPKTSLN